jgi:hypothetical protein
MVASSDTSVDELTTLLTAQCSVSEPIKPIEIDFSSFRLTRQKANDAAVLKAILEDDYKSLVKYANMTEFQRILDDEKTTQEVFLTECKTLPLAARLLARCIAKNASRQGGKDEEVQLTTCATTGAKLGVIIDKLPANAYRASKLDGQIYTKSDVSAGKCNKQDCLKSFDARISGSKLNGWIFAKVCFGSGGHQDNVFREEVEFCQWVAQHGASDKLYVVLVETDTPDKLAPLSRYARDNLFIGNHIQFQEGALALLTL